MMATSTEMPSEAERLAQEAEAGAGAGANHETIATGHAENEKATEEPGLSSSESSVAVVEPKKENTEQPQRSKKKVAVLMGALAVSETSTTPETNAEAFFL